jgi:hypothetical protein
MTNKLFFILLLVSLFFSCNIGLKSGEGRLVVTNNSTNTSDVVTEVWTRVYNSGDWLAKWNGNKALDEEASIDLATGSYDVRVVVKRTALNLSTETISFETGYKAPITLSASDYKFIIFDGGGIYDMENATP